MKTDMSDAVTNRQLYEAIRDIDLKIDDLIDNRILPLERWQANIAGRLAVIGGAALVIIDILIQEIRTKLKW